MFVSVYECLDVVPCRCLSTKMLCTYTQVAQARQYICSHALCDKSYVARIHIMLLVTEREGQMLGNLLGFQRCHIVWRLAIFNNNLLKEYYVAVTSGRADAVAKHFWEPFAKTGIVWWALCSFANLLRDCFVVDGSYSKVHH